MIIGKRIRERREAKGLTQEQLADMIDTEGNTISRWERNKIGIGSAYIVKLAQALDTSTDYLLGETDDPALPQDILLSNPASDSESINKPSGKRLIIKNRDMYVDLPESSEGFEILRKFFDMQAATRNVPIMGQTVIQA